MVWSRWRNFDRTWVNPFEMTHYAAHCPSIAEAAWWGGGQANLTGDGEAVRVGSARVSASLFSTLGVSPALGRGFLAEEDRAGGPQVAVLSHELWQGRYAGDPGIVGRRIEIDRVPHTVVGVMPPRFALPTDFGEDAAEPMRLMVPRQPDEEALTSNDGHGDFGAVRLAPGATAARLTTELRAATGSHDAGRPVSARVRHGCVRGVAAGPGPRPAPARAVARHRRRLPPAADRLRERRQPAAGPGRAPSARDGGARRARCARAAACWLRCSARGCCSRGEAPRRSRLRRADAAGPAGDRVVPSSARHGGGGGPAGVRLRAPALDGHDGAVRAGARVPRLARGSRPGAPGGRAAHARQRIGAAVAGRARRGRDRARGDAGDGRGPDGAQPPVPLPDRRRVRVRPGDDGVAHPARGRVPYAAGDDPVLPLPAGAGPRASRRRVRGPAAAAAAGPGHRRPRRRRRRLRRGRGRRGRRVAGRVRRRRRGPARDAGRRALPLGRRRDRRARRGRDQRGDGAHVLGGTRRAGRAHARGLGRGAALGDRGRDRARREAHEPDGARQAEVLSPARAVPHPDRHRRRAT